MACCFNPVVGFLTVSTSDRPPFRETTNGFNPVVGFLTVSTAHRVLVGLPEFRFQSRRGFSDRLDATLWVLTPYAVCFNPVVGFLTVSTSGV